MTLKEAAAKGIARLRLPIWACEDSYLKIDLIDGSYGPWGHLYAPTEQGAIGQPTPQDFLLLSDKEDGYLEYCGPIVDAGLVRQEPAPEDGR